MHSHKSRKCDANFNNLKRRGGRRIFIVKLRSVYVYSEKEKKKKHEIFDCAVYISITHG